MRTLSTLAAVFLVAFSLAGCDNPFKSDSGTEPTVLAPTPSASANVNNIANFEIVADASSSIGINPGQDDDWTFSCAWSFGDGSSETACKPITHVYPTSASRTYRVTLRVCNNDANRVPAQICDDDVASVTVPE